MFILFPTVRRKTNFLVNLYWDNKYSDSESDSEEPQDGHGQGWERERREEGGYMSTTRTLSPTLSPFAAWIWRERRDRQP